MPRAGQVHLSVLGEAYNYLFGLHLLCPYMENSSTFCNLDLAVLIPLKCLADRILVIYFPDLESFSEIILLELSVVFDSLNREISFSLGVYDTILNKI